MSATCWKRARDEDDLPVVVVAVVVGGRFKRVRFAPDSKEPYGRVGWPATIGRLLRNKHLVD